MRLISAKNKEDMSRKAANVIIDAVRAAPSITLGLATGSTPEGTYRELVRDHLEKETSYSDATTFNLDEYAGLSANHPNSFRHFMDVHLFQHLDIPESRIHLPNGTAVDLNHECNQYDILIEDTGGVDLQLLGIGENGHIGFNEPGTSFDSLTHLETLTESTRRANARFFDRLEDVPTHAITMGIRSILLSNQILLLASGSAKAKAIARLVNGDVSEDFPASALNLHENVMLIADEEALALV